MDFMRKRDQRRALATSDVVFILGAGRSGTTWLHLLVGAHSLVATGQESQLFNNYLRSLYEQWNRELEYPETDKLRKHGITSYIDEARFIELLRQFALSVFENVMNAKPGATCFLEKSPNNAFNVDLIHKCFPDAKFVHMLRDGRDVVTSMLAAKSSWGREWAPTHAYDAAAEWVDAVSETRRLADMTDRYFEVRYESLLENGADDLRSLYEFLELPCSDEEIAEIYDRFSFDKVRNNKYSRDVFLNPGVAKASGTEDRPEPTGFFRKGVAGDWQNSLTEKQLAEVYWAAGDLLKSLSYVDEYERPASPPSSVRRRQRMVEAKGALKRLGSRFLR